MALAGPVLMSAGSFIMVRYIQNKVTDQIVDGTWHYTKKAAKVALNNVKRVVGVDDPIRTETYLEEYIIVELIEDGFKLSTILLNNN